MKLTHNSKPLDGLESFEIQGDQVKVIATPGGYLDGFLGWKAANGARPRLGVLRDGDAKPVYCGRFDVQRESEGRFTLRADGPVVVEVPQEVEG